MAQLGKSNRFYTNSILRDEEWNRAKQPSAPLMALTMAIVAIAFFVGVYGGATQRAAGWVVGIITILTYMGLGWLRRDRARRQLRHLHGQAAS